MREFVVPEMTGRSYRESLTRIIYQATLESELQMRSTA